MKLEIKVGDKFKTKDKGNVFGKEILIVKKVENLESPDGWVTFDTQNLVHRKKYNHLARIWWFREYCEKVN